ncbi:DUF6166 domain-containing protein [Haloplanus salilacus]|uniref:DUF6166 domain-containing protein n=1 Tax=Haloplanus salilacus TaxID=2949994 RepID=UPI0030D2D358
MTSPTPGIGRAGRLSWRAQLALALLLDYTGDEAFALNHYQEFKTEVLRRDDP